ncbi:hypothetical protein [Rhodanobacter lindaniclasticus]|uniref:hypothetical protein n=1 Tax=Rhodanobacter lindaniclasticus TaxID=75310 RepID=UPI00109F0298|nr:hypothetical protein [Rhodanobacter lindaniclasticus]
MIAIVWKGPGSLWLLGIGQIKSGHPWPHCLSPVRSSPIAVVREHPDSREFRAFGRIKRGHPWPHFSKEPSAEPRESPSVYFAVDLRRFSEERSICPFLQPS